MTQPLSHKKAQLYLHAQQESGLSPDEQLRLDAHLKGCAACRAYSAEINESDRYLRYSLKKRWPVSHAAQHVTARQQLKARFVTGAAPSPQRTWVRERAPMLVGFAALMVLSLTIVSLVWSPITQELQATQVAVLPTDPFPTVDGVTPSPTVSSLVDGEPTPTPTEFMVDVAEEEPGLEIGSTEFDDKQPTRAAPALPTAIPTEPRPPTVAPTAVVAPTETPLSAPPTATSIPAATTEADPTNTPFPTPTEDVRLEPSQQLQNLAAQYIAVRNSGSVTAILNHFAPNPLIGSFYNTGNETHTQMQAWINYEIALGSYFQIADCWSNDQVRSINCHMTVRNDLQTALNIPAYQSRLTLEFDQDNQIILHTDYELNATRGPRAHGIHKFLNWLQANYPTERAAIASPYNLMIRDATVVPTMLTLAAEYTASQEP